MEENQGYVVRKSVLFDNGRGFVPGEHPREGFVTWQFTQEYYWGHYHSDPEKARSDFQDRARDYQRRYSVREVERRPSPIAEQMKEAGRQAPPNPKREAPDRGEW